MTTAAVAAALVIALLAGCAPETYRDPNWRGVAVLDSRAEPGRVRLQWTVTTTPDYPDWWDSPIPRPGPRIVRVCVQRSSTGAESDFHILRTSTRVGTDSTIVDGLENGAITWFRVTAYDEAGRQLLATNTVVTSAGAPPSPVASFPLALEGGFDWSPDGEVLACALPNGTYGTKLAIVSTRSGQPLALRLDPTGEEWIGGVSFDSSGRHVLFTRTPTRTMAGIDYRIWAWSFANNSAVPLSPGRVDSDASPAPNGQVVYTRGTYEPPNIYQLNHQWAEPDSTPVRMAAGMGLDCFQPCVRGTDGRVVFDGFAYEHRGRRHLYATSLSGETRTPVTWDDRFADSHATWAEDGESVYFVSDRSGHVEVWRLHPPSGVMRQVTRTPRAQWLEGYRVSRDGHRIALVLYDLGSATNAKHLEICALP